MKTLLEIFACLLLFQSCGGSRSKPGIKYGQDYNAERVKRQITTLPAGYILYPLREGIRWQNPNYRFLEKHHVAYHDEKYIRTSEDGIISEEDDFYSGEMYTAADPEVYKGTEQKKTSLRITYTYKTGGYWDCVLEDRDAPLHLSLGQADSVLKAWGINRIYPQRRR